MGIREIRQEEEIKSFYSINIAKTAKVPLVQVFQSFQVLLVPSIPGIPHVPSVPGISGKVWFVHHLLDHVHRLPDVRKALNQQRAELSVSKVR